MKAANSILTSYGTTIFEVMSQLAQRHGAVNLGQGTPEGLEPQDVIDAAARAMHDGPHQYPSMMGVPELRQAIAAHEKAYFGLDIDWQSEVMITSGGTEALGDCLLGLIEPGDEVVLFEPLYDSYMPIIRRAGGVPKLVRMAPPAWELPLDALRAAFSERTKLVLINNPTNPSAKVFNRQELTAIAELAQEFDTYVICDEVYQHLVYDGGEHIPMISLPGMRERCARIGSFGKVFSVTNWKVGYVVAAPALMQAIAKTHQFITFSTPTSPQMGAAWGLTNRDDYVSGLAAQLQARRDRLSSGLAKLGFTPLTAHGTYFLSADFSALSDKVDSDFCQWMVAEVGVAAVPISAFYVPREDAALPTKTLRFCFAKTDDAIDLALERMGKVFG